MTGCPALHAPHLGWLPELCWVLVLQSLSSFRWLRSNCCTPPLVSAALPAGIATLSTLLATYLVCLFPHVVRMYGPWFIKWICYLHEFLFFAWTFSAPCLPCVFVCTTKL